MESNFIDCFDLYSPLLTAMGGFNGSSWFASWDCRRLQISQQVLLGAFASLFLPFYCSGQLFVFFFPFLVSSFHICKIHAWTTGIGILRGHVSRCKMGALLMLLGRPWNHLYRYPNFALCVNDFGFIVCLWAMWLLCLAWSAYLLQFFCAICWAP